MEARDSSSECPFCDRSIESVVAAFKERHGREPEVHQITDDFRLISDLSPVAQDHYILIPNQHVLSFRSRWSEGLGSTLGLVDRAIAAITSSISAATHWYLFEHGSGYLGGQETKIGSTMAHAHMHVLFVAHDDGKTDTEVVLSRVENAILGEFSEMSRLRWLRPAEPEPCLERAPYLMIASGSLDHDTADVRFFFDSEGAVKSKQVLRRFFYHALGNPSDDGWDWTEAR